MQPPAASVGTLIVLGPVRLIKVLKVSQVKVAVTLVTAAPPVLQTRTPTGYEAGPALGLLLSRPMTFHVVGVSVKPAYAVPTAPTPNSNTRTKTRAANLPAVLDKSLGVGRRCML